MATRSLKPAEVALIKAMLKRGMRNNEVQFHFNRPDRPVNSGRITEIKQGIKWTDVEPVTDEELDAFLADTGKAGSGRGDAEPQVPDQLPTAALFSFGDEGRIDLVPDPPGQIPGADPELEGMYSELRQKTGSILTAGHNLLGTALEPLEHFFGALPEDMSEASMTIVWFRGNALRSILRAHDEVRDSNDMHPEKLDPAYAERLRDIVEAFNIFVLGDPKGSALDNKRFGPTDRETADKAIELAKPIAEHSSEIATPVVSSLLEEQIDGSINAPDTIDGDQAVDLARQTSSNFIITIVKSGLSAVRAALGNEFSNAWKCFSAGIYTTIGGIAVLQHEQIIGFILRHADKLSSYIGTVIENPTVLQIIDFIVKLFRSF